MTLFVDDQNGVSADNNGGFTSIALGEILYLGTVPKGTNR